MSPTRRHPSFDWLCAIAIPALTLLAYLPAMRGAFIWDDDAYLTGNRLLRSADGLWRIWFEPTASPQYYPLVFSSFWVEQRLWGLSPLGYHVVNVALHAGTGLLLWRVLVWLAIPGAWVAAMLFALHPVQAESVAWIAERKNVLSGFFYMAAAFVYLRARGPRETEAHRSQAWASADVLTLVCYVAALLSKTVTCSLPAALLLIAWWQRGRLTWPDVRPLLPLFAIGIGLAMITVHIEQAHVGAVGADWDLSIVERCLIAGRALWFYAASLVWPSSLTFIYPRWSIDVAAWWQYLFPLTAIGLLGALFAMRQRIGRGPVAAVAFFAGTLLPALGFINVFPMRYSFVADHFQYLACIGLLVLAVGGVAQWPLPGAERSKAIVAGAVLVFCGALTFRQGFIYADLETLWRDTLAKNPAAWMAHNNLGLILLQRGDNAAARNHFNAALALKRDDAYAHNNIGNVLAREGNLAEAMEHFRAAARIEPSNAEAHGNMGNISAARGEWAEAIVALSQAIRIKPDYADAHSNLGNVLALQGQTADAIVHYRAALAIDPDFAAAHHNLGVLLVQAGTVDEAMAHWRAAIALNPNGADSHTSLGIVLAQRGVLGEAERHLEAALRIEPDNERARQQLTAIRAAR